MPKKKPCSICRRWFQPHPRAGRRQKACGDCQRERHRRACAAWRDANPDSDRKRRLKKAARFDEAADADEPLEAVDWQAVERAIGPAHRVVVEGIATLLNGCSRDAVPPKVVVDGSESPRVRNGRLRDAVAPGAGGNRQESLKVRRAECKTQSARDGPDP